MTGQRQDVMLDEGVDKDSLDSVPGTEGAVLLIVVHWRGI